MPVSAVALCLPSRPRPCAVKRVFPSSGRLVRGHLLGLRCRSTRRRRARASDATDGVLTLTLRLRLPRLSSEAETAAKGSPSAAWRMA